MAKVTSSSSGWLKGRVKAVLSGDTLVVMGIAKAVDEIPPEKTIVLAHLFAPRLARKEGKDAQFAWQSREFLRELCIGKDIVFKTEYTIPNTSKECSSVFIGSKNIAKEVVTNGWAKVKEAKRKVTPEHAELLTLEQKAKRDQLGLWNKAPVAVKAAIRNLPPSAVGNPSNLNAERLVAAKKFRRVEAIVEHVRDGSCLYAYLLPEFQFVKVFVTGIQAPSMGRRNVTDESKSTTSASTDNEGSPDPYGREAKHFTEMRVLNRDVEIVLECVDKSGHLVGSVYYLDGEEKEKDLALELVANGYAKYVEWSGCTMTTEARWNLIAAEREAKKNKLRMWRNFVPPATKSKAITNFTGKVIEVVSGDCIIIADDSVPVGSPAAETRVNLSGLWFPEPGYARAAKELLRTRLIGRQVQVSMEYSRRQVPKSVGVTGFGSVFLMSQGKNSEGVSGVDAAQLIISYGFGSVNDNDFEERSDYYENLYVAESRAKASKKGIHSSQDPPVMHVTDVSKASPKKATEVLQSLQRARRVAATVEYVQSGHRFELFVPKEQCSIAFSLSGVRCPGREECYSDEALSLMRRKLMQRDVEIEVETMDRNGTFLGSLWESRTNAGVTLLEAGLARLQTSFRRDKIADAHLLAQAEQLARNQKLKIWGKDTNPLPGFVDSVLKEEKWPQLNEVKFGQLDMLKLETLKIEDGSETCSKAISDCVVP
uniref:ribonuclease TUDOR 1-like n=1 Tax=Erigeron canadensis TaxID=72917 RepID=UPI001CB99A42|nr:ribonuclease TUDOR 1-like [Erigeron canadensis]